MRIFLATSFSSQVDRTGNVRPEFKNSVEKIIQHFEGRGDEIFCAARTENWKIADQNPTEALKVDFEHIENCDQFVALLSDNVSAGVQLEMGYALALRKKISLVVQDESKLGWTNKAMLNLPSVQLEAL